MLERMIRRDESRRDFTVNTAPAKHRCSITNAAYTSLWSEAGSQPCQGGLPKAGLRYWGGFVGQVVDVTTLPTENGRFLFSDYRVQITEVHRQPLASPLLKEGATVVVTRPGGEFTVDDVVVTASIRSFPPLTVGTTYSFLSTFFRSRGRFTHA